MNKQEFKIYMEKCRVPQSLQPIIEQYRNCFGQNLREIGLIKTNPPSEFRLTIARNWNGQPYHTTPYSQTPEEQEAIEKYVQEQLEAGKIEPVSDLTGWNHSCTVAKKKDNEITGAKNRLRVCVDYKPINAVTETVSFAIPAKEEILESIGQWNMYIAIDISSAYTHIPIPPQYRHYLAFSIKNGEKYQPVVMNFGGKCMPMVFAAAMRRVFRPLINNGWFYQYFDDLTIGGNNEEDLTEMAEQVFEDPSAFEPVTNENKEEGSNAVALFQIDEGARLFYIAKDGAIQTTSDSLPLTIFEMRYVFQNKINACFYIIYFF